MIGSLQVFIGIIFSSLALFQKKKEKVASFLMDVGNLIIEVADNLEEDVYPHTACARMGILVDNLPEVLKGTVDTDTIAHLYEALDRARNIEGLYGDYKCAGDASRYLSELRRLAGNFLGSADILKTI